MIGTFFSPIDPLLGALADNAGPTKTHALLPGSPAIDAGDPAAVAGASGVPLQDQRGAAIHRVVDGDGASGTRIDMGAYERQPVTGLRSASSIRWSMKATGITPPEIYPCAKPFRLRTAVS